MTWVKTVSLAIVTSLITSPVVGQWFDHPTAGIPRTADGKPDLTAPAPKLPDGKPDFSGMWHRSATRYYNNIAADLEPADVQPWAEALYQQRRADFGKDSMDVRCLPYGPAATTTPYADIKIVQTPTLIVMLLEDLTYRQIHIDGRQLPEDPNPSWMGYSAVSVPLELFPDTEILEHVCQENEKSTLHMTGSPAGQAQFSVAQETLAKYAGTYEILGKDNVIPAVVSISGDGLFLDLDQAGPEYLAPMSETDFSMSGTLVQFVADGQGAISHLVIQTVEGEDTAIRKR